jgi:hypothetical protein
VLGGEAVVGGLELGLQQPALAVALLGEALLAIAPLLSVLPFAAPQRWRYQRATRESSACLCVG